jgi:hypothetical protein
VAQIYRPVWPRFEQRTLVGALQAHFRATGRDVTSGPAQSMKQSCVTAGLQEIRASPLGVDDVRLDARSMPEACRVVRLQHLPVESPATACGKNAVRHPTAQFAFVGSPPGFSASGDALLHQLRIAGRCRVPR